MNTTILRIVFPSVSLAALVCMAFLLQLPYNGFSACAICGCNEPPSPQAGAAITGVTSPVGGAYIPQCCDTPWPTDLNSDGKVDGNDLAIACGVSIVAGDTDRLQYYWWAHEGQGPCNCVMYGALSFPNDPVTVTWSGSVDRCSPGTYALTATVKNVAVQTAPLGGEVCSDWCEPDSENCCGTSGCNQLVPVSVMEEKTFTIPVTVFENPCGGCKPQSVSKECEDILTPLYNGPTNYGAAYEDFHNFTYYMAGVTQGAGRSGSEVVDTYATVTVKDKNGNTVFSDPRYKAKDAFESGLASMPCAQDCNNSDAVFWPDKWGITLAVPASDWLSWANFDLSKFPLHVTLRMEISTQKIYVDRSIGGGVPNAGTLLGTFSDDLTLTFDISKIPGGVQAGNASGGPTPP